jgi:hypothetical protein
MSFLFFNKKAHLTSCKDNIMNGDRAEVGSRKTFNNIYIVQKHGVACQYYSIRLGVKVHRDLRFYSEFVRVD